MFVSNSQALFQPAASWHIIFLVLKLKKKKMHTHLAKKSFWYALFSKISLWIKHIGIHTYHPTKLRRILKEENSLGWNLVLFFPFLPAVSSVLRTQTDLLLVKIVIKWNGKGCGFYALPYTNEALICYYFKSLHHPCYPEWAAEFLFMLRNLIT